MTWRDNIGPLSKAFRVYAVDFPGHGDSDKPDFDYATETILRFVAHVMETLKLDRAAIIGTSVGGAVGLMMALRFPHLVDSASLGKEVPLLSAPGVGSRAGRIPGKLEGGWHQVHAI